MISEQLLNTTFIKFMRCKFISNLKLKVMYFFRFNNNNNQYMYLVWCWASTFFLLMRVSLNIIPDVDFFPMPQNVQLGQTNSQLLIKNPCSILYKLKFQIQQDYSHLKQIIQHYQYKTFGCRSVNIIAPQSPKNLKLKNFQYTLNIFVKNPKINYNFNKLDEKYSLKITKQDTNLTSETYVGFVRGIDTFLQIISCTQNKLLQCRLSKLPIQIVDWPQFQHRGIMIDSTRHFLPIRLVYETIDAMMYNKMSILHWHLSDDASFPLKLHSHPQLAQKGAFSEEQVYTPQDIKKLVRYAAIRGVKIIPEIPTPSHSSSWIKSHNNLGLKDCANSNKEISFLDIKNNESINLIKQVFSEILQLFPNDFIHLGGQSIKKQCLNQSGNIDSNQAYRKNQKNILRELYPDRKFIYWQDKEFKGDLDDIVHWTGRGYPNQSKNKIIISHQNFHRLDFGVGDQRGYHEGQYLVWYELYQQNIKNQIENYANKQNIIGAEMLLWSQSSNQYTHHIKLWMRSSCLAERLWNSDIQPGKTNILKRITRHQRVMHQRGIPTAPVTCQNCEVEPSNC